MWWCDEHLLFSCQQKNFIIVILCQMLKCFPVYHLTIIYRIYHEHFFLLHRFTLTHFFTSKQYFHWLSPFPLTLNLIQNQVTWQWLTKPIISHIWIYHVILRLHHNEKLQHISFHTVLYICSSCFHIMTLHDDTIQVT